jgi:hypothetical protein
MPRDLVRVSSGKGVWRHNGGQKVFGKTISVSGPGSVRERIFLVVRCDRVGVVAGAFGQPYAQRADGLFGQWYAALPAVFASAAQVSAGAEVGIAAGERDEFGYS